MNRDIFWEKGALKRFGEFTPQTTLVAPMVDCHNHCLFNIQVCRVVTIRNVHNLKCHHKKGLSNNNLTILMTNLTL